MRRLFKWLGILLVVILVLLLCSVLLAYYLVGTEKGFNFTAGQIVERVKGLEIANVKGSLKNGIQADQIDFKNEQINLSAKGVDTRWRAACLIDKQLCLDKVVIDELNIETFASDTPVPASTDDIVFPEIKLPGSFDAKEILVKKLIFKAPGEAPVQVLENIKISAHSDQETLRIDELSTQYKNITVFGSGTLTPTGAYPINLDIKIDVQNFLDDFDASTQINLTNTVTDMQIDAAVEGAVNATVTGRVKPLMKKLPVDLVVKTDLAGWPLDTNAIAQASDVDLRIIGDLDDYRVDLQAKVNGEQIPDTTLKVAAFTNTERALITDLTALTLGGFITGNAAVSWHTGVVWVTDIIAKDINPAIKYPGVEGKLNGLILANGDLIDEKWTLDVKKAHIDGMLRDVPFNLDTQLVKRANDTWQIDSLELENGRNSVTANGSFSDVLKLNAMIQMPQLQNFLPGLTGGFTGTLDVNGEPASPNVKIKATSDTIKYNEIVIANLSLDADVKRGALDDSKLSLNLREVTAGTQSVKNIKLNLAGSRKRHTIALFADGPEKTSIDLLADGSLTQRFDWNGVLKKVKLEVPAHVINLRDPTSLAWNNETKKFIVQPHCWAIQESNLCLKNQVLAQDTGQALIGLDAYRLEQLDPFLPAESTLSGRLKADITLDWGAEFAGGYAAKLDASITDGGINVRDTSGQPLSFKYDTLTLTTTADATSVSAALTVDSKTMGQANIDLELDPASEQKSITGKIDLSGFQLGFLKAFLPNYETISGQVSTKGDLSGALLDPLYNGNVVLSDLIIKSDDLPLSIDGGNITALITGKRADINGQLKTGEGSIGITGRANWLNNSYRADINIDANKLNIVQDPVTSSTINAKITLSASPENIRVRGSVDIPAAEINIIELPKGAATLSDDVIVIEDIYAQTQKNQKKKQTATPIDLRINVSLGDKVNLAAYGLKASLKGDMSVSQTSPNPLQLGGEVTIVSGIFKQYGQDLRITDGQVLFVGPIDQTTLDIDAVRTIRESDGTDRIAGLHIDGRIEDPEISLFTEPADKTQESILSYIVLGRDIGSASNEESNLLASAALALTLKGGRAYTETLAESLGIQEITLDARGRGNTTEVVVSGRVNDRLLLRYGRSVFDDSFTLYLRYDLTKKLYLEAAQGTARAVDIFYSFAF